VQLLITGFLYFELVEEELLLIVNDLDFNILYESVYESVDEEEDDDDEEIEFKSFVLILLLLLLLVVIVVVELLVLVVLKVLFTDAARTAAVVAVVAIKFRFVNKQVFLSIGVTTTFISFELNRKN